MGAYWGLLSSDGERRLAVFCAFPRDLLPVVFFAAAFLATVDSAF